MGQQITLQASDGKQIGAYEAKPQGQARGGVVVLQEIFGVNSHIRNVCDRLAAEGLHAVAPALFDRAQPGFESGYTPDEIAKARQFIGGFDWEAAVLDTTAAVRHLGAKPVALMGFCLGGSLAYLTATRTPDLAAAVCYYGGAIVKWPETKPLCPTLMHFGRTDTTIPLDDVEKVRAAHPDCEIHLYDAGHGFNCDERGSYDAASAKLAWDRSGALMDRQFKALGAR